MELLGFSAGQLAWIAATALLAFVVRGLSGFGSSMLGIGSLTLLLPPLQVVPAFLALELLTTAHLLPGVWRQVDWRSLRWVIVGCALATPLGLTVLAGLDPNPMRLLVSLTLLGIAGLMLSGLAQRFTPRQTPGPAGALAAGAASGLLNGAAGIGGPPAIVFYFATTAAATGRASLIAYFLFTDVWALAWAGGAGLLDAAAWPLIVVALPFSLAGIWLGQRLYLRLDEAQLRRLVWCLLAGLGALGVARGLAQLLAGPG
ncbi:MAG: sulfite exporter TauE/SafE family protein [Pseudomonadota bacterium]